MMRNTTIFRTAAGLSRKTSRAMRHISVAVIALAILVIGMMPLPQAEAGTPTNLMVTVDHGTDLSLSGAASSVFIANPDIADVQVMSPTSVMIFGKRTGSTTFMATDRNGRVLAHYTVQVTQDLSDLRLELDQAIPGNKIHVQGLPNGIVLTGEARDPAAVADAYKLAQRYIATGGDIINRVHVLGSNQIQIRVRFAEVSRTVDTTLGIDWSSSFATAGGLAFGVASGSQFLETAGSNQITRPNNASLTAPNDVFSFQHSGKHTNLNNLIDALAQDGLVTILAEPNLTAMSGETANFLAGGEFPIPVPQSSGNSGGLIVTVDFKTYGVSLAFTPTLVGENRVNLHVKPEVSELSDTGAIVLDNITIPALTTRKAETTVEVASGESFAIAGLIDNSQAQTINKYPIIGDMPILGPLFRSNEFKNNQSELVIIITPYIVHPADNAQALALPTDGYAPPSDYDRLVKMRYSASDPNAQTMSGAPAAVAVQPAAAISSPAPAPLMPVTQPNALPALQPQSQTTPRPITTSAVDDEDAPSMEPGDGPQALTQNIAQNTPVNSATSEIATPAPRKLLPPPPTHENTNGFIVE